MKKLCKSQTDKKLLGVCGGVAEYLEVDATMVRLAWAILTLLGGSGFIIYIIAAVLIPYC
ncbi:PspC domain-containing protein [Tannockella kyphosi]|uniref:PspC domain-containing protein n=1 Tax=Tannockella kyphosi TaxID=2899121 RepID=UPI00201127FA|nr:PspC domain-containing protein [Tannockella kyphosi]